MKDSGKISNVTEMKNHPDIHIVVAMTRERLIGNAGQMPWNLPHDLTLFRKLTAGHTVVMGRKTFFSIGKVLPDRSNIVISSSAITDDAVETFASFDEGISRGVDIGRKIFCIGGRDIYRAALPFASHLHISWVDGSYAGDTFFPDFDLADWTETARELHTGFTHITYQRK